MVQSTFCILVISTTESFIKVNIDGNSVGNPKVSGFGGLIRDSYAQWKIEFSSYNGIATNMSFELMVITMGFK
uniref:RNase H type-1 domain-containing protein n=1 Tax=Cajanus cajan TaxID=3821 RepID=A0A151RR91_CAJCA|nr:hypothetical protein KK1_033419 [Cajanus cajan]